MDANQGPEDTFRSLLARCDRALEEVTLPESAAGMIEAWQRLEDLSSALATVKTRLEVAVVLSRVPIPMAGAGTSRMASEAADRLLLAIKNVVALRDT